MRMIQDSNDEYEYMSDTAESRWGAEDVRPLAGAEYVGRRFPFAERVEMFVVRVNHPNGPWEAIYCHTEAQAQEIARIEARLARLELALDTIARGEYADFAENVARDALAATEEGAER